MKNTRPHRRGVTMLEVSIAALALITMVAVAAPTVEITSCDAAMQRSINNLRILGTAHAKYAADNDDRQFTLAPDDLSAFGLCEAYPDLPAIALGRNCEGVEQSIDSCILVQPIDFMSEFVVGSFRISNAAGFHQYVNGKFFDPVFYAPKDPVLATLNDLGAFDEDCGFNDFEGAEDYLLSATYINSPAALFHPDVLRQEDDGGYQSPYSFDDGFKAPTVSQAQFPDLKTRMIEHLWLQDLRPDALVNPCFVDDRPYYFNQGYNSRPMTLFFDGHVNGLAVPQVMRDRHRLWGQTGGDKTLWSTDTPLGEDGYFSQCSYDWSETSFHILTTEGIRGRDRLADP